MAPLWERGGEIHPPFPLRLSSAIRSGDDEPTGAVWQPAKPQLSAPVPAGRGGRRRGGKGKANMSSRVAGVLETRKALAGDTYIRCFQTITKPA